MENKISLEDDIVFEIMLTINKSLYDKGVLTKKVYEKANDYIIKQINPRREEIGKTRS